MGKKKTPAEKAEEAAATNKKEEEEAEKKAEAQKEAEEENDPPLVKELKAVDDKYLELEREYEREQNELERKFDARRAPLLEERLKLLTGSPEEGKTVKGTPALEGFWLQAMRNLPALEDQIEDWDEPVLEYLRDVTRTNLDEEDSNKGFKLTFHFVENPYFTNEVLWKEYHTKESSPYTGEINATNIKVSEIEWKPGKNVTVETTKKKVKGGGAKKQKKKDKETTEPRDSFFRNFFRNLHSDMDVPDDVNLDGQSDDEEEEDMMEMLMEYDYDMGMAIRDQLIPFAVRWYTGEARPEDDDDDEDEEEEDDDYEDDDDEDDDDEEDEPPPKKKAQPKKKGGSGGGEEKKKGGGGAGDPKPEECKQQ